MMENSPTIEQLDRLLAEIPYCQAHPGISISEVARQFGITREQVMTDLKLAWTCELPGGVYGELIDLDLEAMEDEGIIFVSRVDTLERPLRITATEAASLQLALTVIADVGSSSLRPAIAGLQQKIAAASTDVPRIADAHVESGSPLVRDLLSKAISSAERVRLTYDGSARGATTHPTVDPAQIVVRDGVSYLMAYAVDRQAWRTYRMDRIAEVVGTGLSAQAHGSADLDSWAKDLEAGTMVVITCARPAASVLETSAGARVDHDDQGRVRVTIPVVNPAWIVRLLLRLGDDVLMVDPPVYSREAKREAARALHAYESLR